MEIEEITLIASLAMLFLSIPFCVELYLWADSSINNEKEYKYLSPKTLYEQTEMNIIGCILTWLALGVISPIMLIYKCIYNLFHI